jgi:hypothetical protein
MENEKACLLELKFLILEDMKKKLEILIPLNPSVHLSLYGIIVSL